VVSFTLRQLYPRRPLDKWVVPEFIFFVITSRVFEYFGYQFISPLLGHNHTELGAFSKNELIRVVSAPLLIHIFSVIDINSFYTEVKGKVVPVLN